MRHKDCEKTQPGQTKAHSFKKKYPKIQILTIADLLGGKQIDMPPLHEVGATFKKAPKVNQQAGEENELGF